MRHETLFMGEQFEQLRIDFHPVERRHPQPLKGRKAIQHCAHQLAERRRIGQVVAP